MPISKVELEAPGIDAERRSLMQKKSEYLIGSGTHFFYAVL